MDCPFDILIIPPDGVKCSTRDCYSQDWFSQQLSLCSLLTPSKISGRPTTTTTPPPPLDYRVIPDINQLRRSRGCFITPQHVSSCMWTELNWFVKLHRGTEAASKSFLQRQKRFCFLFHLQLLFKPATFRTCSDVRFTYSSHMDKTQRRETPTHQSRIVWSTKHKQEINPHKPNIYSTEVTVKGLQCHHDNDSWKHQPLSSTTCFMWSNKMT